MIKANELRIGNLVIKRTETDCGYHTEYSKITPSIISSAASDGEIDFIEPIPLTPEILEKAGFEYNDILDEENSYWYIQNKWIAIYLNSSKVSIGGSSDPDRHHWIENFKYVHQLQNLYFALTGEELEVNL